VCELLDPRAEPYLSSEKMKLLGFITWYTVEAREAETRAARAQDVRPQPAERPTRPDPADSDSTDRDSEPEGERPWSQRGHVHHPQGQGAVNGNGWRPTTYHRHNLMI
jgi:hypothetical protein